MNNNHESLSFSMPNIALDQQLFEAKRGSQWMEMNQKTVADSIGHVMDVFGLDAPWEDIAESPVKKAAANALWSCTLACFGPTLSHADLSDLNAKVTGIAEDGIEYKFTSNHMSVPVKLHSVDSMGHKTNEYAMVHYMPAFASGLPGFPSIGDVSPIALEQGENGYVLSMKTPSGHVWQKSLEVIPFKEYVQKSLKNKSTLFTDVVFPCVSNFQVLNVRPTCEEGCLMCTVEKGDGQISSEHKENVGKAFDVLIDEAMKSGKAFQLSISGGSLKGGDAGFESGHGWALSILKEKLDEKGFHHPVQLQLEVILPSDPDSWPGIIDTIFPYVKHDGWQVSLAINIEAVQETWKSVFLPGANKSVTSVDDHVSFAHQLAKKTDGKVQINSLVLFGMKPVGLSDTQYLTADLQALQKLVDAGIKPNFQPVKIENSTKLKAHPVPNPIELLMQDVALKVMIKKAGLTASPGCVGGCNACDQTHETQGLLMALGKAGILPGDFVYPLAHTVSPEYADALISVLNPPISEKGVVYEAK